MRHSHVTDLSDPVEFSWPWTRRNFGNCGDSAIGRLAFHPPSLPAWLRNARAGRVTKGRIEESRGDLRRDSPDEKARVQENGSLDRRHEALRLTPGI